MINLLDKSIFELIAAGEVIERPASVIKELVENAIDAGAKRITVEIKNGGIRFMRVTDDGCGMSYEDVPLAFLRHATSKVSAKDDLDKITTLGFRGEALASVSAVSRVELTTKRQEDNLGTEYRICGSVEEVYEECGCADGTNIVIRDLFYNVPARRKFLRNNNSEAAAVINVVEKAALSHPEIAFQIINNGNLEWNTPAVNDLFTTIRALYGKNFAGDMIPVEYYDKNVKIYGYTVKPLYARNRRKAQNFFVNKRYVHSLMLRRSIEEAYHSLIMQGKFPACVLFIEVDPSLVDVNIHPAKAEVRFANERDVNNTLYFAIKNAFIQNGLLYDFRIEQETEDISLKPKFDNDLFFNTQAETFETKAELLDDTDISLTEYIETKKPIPSPILKQLEIPSISQKNFSKHIEADFRYIQPVKNPVPNEEEKLFINVLGEFNKSYILAETNNGLTIIDKHAAHERVLYEKLKNETDIESQFLLHPLKILLTKSEFNGIKENVNLLENLGFSVDISEEPVLKITSVPQIFEDLDIEAVFTEIIKNIADGKISVQSEKYDDILHTMACKAAIKARDITSSEE
ncbi:MAG: DNA mismatch repair endonuclease MutL [Oscillospiraceae bacterium]|jgi:DNA mismatch repair protein MutL|nr:DNA mismatch repair endonuclease MutL [Oscillospiraceae bacterium]